VEAVLNTLGDLPDLALSAPPLKQLLSSVDVLVRFSSRRCRIVGSTVSDTVSAIDAVLKAGSDLLGQPEGVDSTALRTWIISIQV
jgi:hypothetical protein